MCRCTSNPTMKVTYNAYAVVQFQDHFESMCMSVIKLGARNLVIFRRDWLMYHNPEIDWDKCEITLTRCPSKCHYWFKCLKGHWGPKDQYTVQNLLLKNERTRSCSRSMFLKNFINGPKFFWRKKVIECLSESPGIIESRCNLTGCQNKGS